MFTLPVRSAGCCLRLVLLSAFLVLGPVSCTVHRPNFGLPSVTIDTHEVLSYLNMIDYIYDTVRKDLSMSPEGSPTVWDAFSYRIDERIYISDFKTGKKVLFGAFVRPVRGEDKVIVILRGTVTPGDRKADFETGGIVFKPYNGDTLPGNSTAEEGFYRIYQRVRSQIMNYISRNRDVSEVVFAGHSLGAVVASYASFDAAYSLDIKNRVYGYATPAGMNADMVVQFKNVVRSGKLLPVFITNSKDIVPRLTGSFGYSGFPKSSYLDICFYNRKDPDSIGDNHFAKNYLDVLRMEFGREKELSNKALNICVSKR